MALIDPTGPVPMAFELTAELVRRRPLPIGLSILTNMKAVFVYRLGT